MDQAAVQALRDVLAGQLAVSAEICSRVHEVRFFINSECHAFWDATFICHFYRNVLRPLNEVISGVGSTLEWTSHLSSSLVDDACYSRSLLVHALLLIGESGLISDRHDAAALRADICREQKHQGHCAVAYIDYVGAGKDFDWERFRFLWDRMSAEAIRRGFAGYYWRSSDSFYFVRPLGAMPDPEKKRTAAEDLLEFMLHIQDACVLPPGESSWMWEVGLAIETGTVVGDIFLPGPRATSAARAMKLASDKLRGGGAILANPEFTMALSARASAKMKSLRGEPTGTADFFFYDREAK